MRHFITSLSKFAPSLLILCGLVACQSSRSKTGLKPLSAASKDPAPYTIQTKSYPKLLDFKELTSLLREHGKSTAASKKAQKLFHSPFIDNSHYRKHGLPNPHSYTQLGKALRVTSWNIEKSRHVNRLANALKSEKYYISQLDSKVRNKSKKLNESLRQRQALALSDILLCQEMDIGHCRSEYLFAAKHLANKLGMNFVYAPQQLEIDPVYLGHDDVKFPNMNVSSDNCHGANHQQKYKGVFGVAVMSRYPIKRVQVFPLQNQPYDWYLGEIAKPDMLENLRRYSSKKIFNVKPSREVKIGGRGFTRVDLHVPGVPNETVSVINIHLEIKTRPKNRLAQMREILDYIVDIKNPVIMAGDFNNSAIDVSSTSVQRATTRTASNTQNHVSTLLHFAGVTTVNQFRNVFNFAKNFKNPLAWHVPALLPNRTKSLFCAIEDFRFNDGGAFDFRGNENRSLRNQSGTLSNSNQRNLYKGFTFSFSVPKSIGPLGQDRLDWIFVKSLLTHPRDNSGPYKLAPHFGETLRLVNRTAKTPYSDHHPITVLLPMEEPDLE